MILEAEFVVSDQMFKGDFGVVRNISDGGYERGYAEGFTKGEAEGFTAGQTEGYEQGKAEAVENLPYGYLKVDPAWTVFSQLCRGRSSLVANLKYSDTANGTNFSEMFYSCTAKSIPSLDLRKGTNFASMFIYSSELEEIGEMDISNATNVNYMFLNCYELKRVYFVPGCIKLDISFSYCSKLEDDARQSIVDGYADMTGKTSPTLTVHPTVGAKMSDAQKATLTAKNVTLVY